MADNTEAKVVIKQSVLMGGNQSDDQKVAVVYISGSEYRVYAPGEAKGEALDWVSHLRVRQLDESSAEVNVPTLVGVLALRVVKEELEKQRRDVARSKGMHPDGLHCAAQICLRGHIQHCDGMPFDPKTHCTECGEPCVDACPRCNEPIRGVVMYQHKTTYSLPRFCHSCGRPYPWMEDVLRTARELLNHDDKLTLDDRNSLWSDLQYVMSDPKADLVPAKKKLINIKLDKATQFVREAVLELLAKTTAEYLKPGH